MKILAIDPGSKSGAFALLTETGSIIGDLPITTDGVNAAELYRMIREWTPDAAIVERVNAFPGQGVSSVWAFGKAYGAILAVLAAAQVPVELVTPSKWKSHYKLPGKDKEAARARAIELYPGQTGLARVKDHGRAEALLMARYYQTEIMSVRK